MNVHSPKGNDLAVMEILTPAIVFAPGGIDEVLGKIKAEVSSVVADISTDAGRKAVASTAYKIARSKTALDKMGKDLGESHHKAWKAITTERSRIATELDALKDEFRKPLTDWENAEKDRVTGHEDALNSIALLMMFNQEPTANEVALRIADLGSIARRDWQEFSKRAEDAVGGAGKSLAAKLAAVEKREAEAAELARLRQEQIERERRERDERIAREAAERARADAEEKAARAQALADAKAREEMARVSAIAENERLRAEREKLAAERTAREAVTRAEKAAARAKEDAEAAVQNERLRVEREKAAAEREAARREADKKHRGAINVAARDALVKAGLTEEQAVCAVGAIARGEVPNVKISY